MSTLKTTALRSEQAAEEYSTLPGVQGVPGALSNQPTPAGTAPETVTNAENQKNNLPSSSSKSATKNFEVDKRITHTRVSTGQLRRLTVAVVVDDKKTIDAEGKIKSQAYNQEELDRFTDLVKQAVGFNAERGDQVTVTNVAFKPDEPEVIPELPIWKQAWFIDLLKQIAAAIAVLFLIFGVLRPAMRRLAGRSEAEIKQELEAKLLAQKEAELMAAKEKERQLAEQQAAEQQALAAAQAHAEAQAQANVPEATPSEDGKLEANQEAIDLLLLETPPTYETRLEYVKQLVDNDSKLVSEVIKTWIK
nr:flagellar M-ring protein FliF C-terminal domain-containing protein [Methylocucumis oryzae]